MAALWQESGLMASPAHIGLVLPALGLGFVVFALAAGSEVKDERGVALGRSLYAVHCAQCHGKTLEGQPDWQIRQPNGRLPAPPHDASGHTWHHPDKVLIGITKQGLKPYAGEDYESDMPAFAGKLSDHEIEAVIAFIKSTWPERQKEYQARQSARSSAAE